MTRIRQALRLLLFWGFVLGLGLQLKLHLVEARASQGLRVQLPHGGWLIGRHRTTHSGRHMRAFMGVPYALPPLAELRFQPPVEQPGWMGERLAVKDAPICMQRDPYRRDMIIEGSEDCLYLNVYTPDPVPAKPLPVMIWFHGGGWQCGSGISSFYGPDFLLEHDIILVSANFRLGPLGFLSTETLDCPGNNGLKDQLQVLRWVRDNIASFGGDPGSVTVFGESAGGASVTYHMLSEQSRGLLHRGIAQSGTYYNPWAQPAHKGVAAKRARKLTQLVGCSAAGKDWAAKLECLRSKPAEDIVATLYDMFVWDFDPMIPFPPVIEPVHEGAFLTERPREAAAPHGLELPLMMGVTSEEGLLKTAAMLNMPQLLEEFKTKFEQLLPVVLNYDHHKQEAQQQITQNIETFYFSAGHNYNKSNHQNLTDLISDGWFVAGIDEYLQMRLADQHQRKAPTYVYLFEHRGAASFSELFKGGRDEFYGACHAEELQYLFPIGRELFVSAVPTPQDLKLRELMLSFWVNFARTGNPNPVVAGNSSLPSWLPTSSYPVDFARLGTKLDVSENVGENLPPLLSMEAALLQHRADFWRDLKAHLPAHQWPHQQQHYRQEL